MEETGVVPQHLEFEITETVAMTGLEGSEQVLSELKNMGIMLSIDDFGTGYSSLARIKELPVSILKIDKSFIQKVGASSNDAAIVKSIIRLAQSLDLGVVAEGAETKEQVRFLTDSGCQFTHGYYFSRPVKANELIRACRH